MAIQKLAIELGETTRQTRELVDSIGEALNILLDKSLSDTEARSIAINKIMIGLQAQDRIEQRCSNMTAVIENMRDCAKQLDTSKCSNVWEDLTLEELTRPELSGSSGRTSHGDVDLF